VLLVFICTSLCLLCDYVLGYWYLILCHVLYLNGQTQCCIKFGECIVLVVDVMILVCATDAKLNSSNYIRTVSHKHDLLNSLAPTTYLRIYWKRLHSSV